jgi:hypothetical protein
MTTTRRAFLRGLLASTVAAPSLSVAVEAMIAQPNVTTTFRSETFRCEIGIISEEWRDVVRIASLPDLPGYRPCDHLDLPLGFDAQSSHFVVQWGEFEAFGDDARTL